jgi:hypothetical protein
MTSNVFSLPSNRSDTELLRALVTAQEEWWEQPDIDTQDARDAVEWIGLRAAELLTP